MRINEFIQYIENRENKKIEEICYDFKDQTILWINPSITHKYELLVWDSDYKEVLIRHSDTILKEHPRAEWLI